MANFAALQANMTANSGGRFQHCWDDYPELPNGDDVYNIDEFEHPETGQTGRHYVIPQPEGKLYFPSATNVLGQIAHARGEDNWVESWREAVGHEVADQIVHDARVRGTAMHDMAELYLRNEMVRAYHIDAWRMFLKIQPMLDRINNIMCLEHALFSKILRVAGRVDCVAELDGVLTLIDFKTSRKNKERQDIPSYFYQVCLYSWCIREMTGVIIDFGAILMSIKEGKADKKPDSKEFEVIIGDYMPALLHDVIKLRDSQGLSIGYSADHLTDYYFGLKELN